MTGKWKNAYAELDGYILRNPEIKLSKGITIIPVENREEFYRLFDNTTLAALKELTPEVFEEVLRLSKSYQAEAERLKQTLKIQEIKTPPRLNVLLNDPSNGLSRALFDAFFDFLKAPGDFEAFERKAEDMVETFWRPLHRQGYEDWAMISLANMLAPETVLASSWDEIARECHELQPDQKRGWTEHNVPQPEEVGAIELGHEGYDPAFIISDLIIRSRKLNRYVSFGAGLTDAAWYATNASENRNWIKLRERGLDLKPRLDWPGFVINTANEAADISLIADFERFLQPEVMVECIVQERWYDTGYPNKVKSRHEFFKPSSGTFIVSRVPVPDEILKRMDTVGISVISGASYNRESLAPIIDTLTSSDKTGT